MTKKSFVKFLVVTSSAALLLSGCESVKSFEWPKFGSETAQADNCPVVGITPDLGNVTQIRSTQIVSETIISSIKPTCTLADNNTTVRMAIDFKGRLGPEGLKDAKTEANYSIPYLIAVIDPKGAIISKDIFAITMTYKQNQTEQSFNDLLEQVIPLKEGEKPSDYKVMLGFQLDDQQLSYNRALSAAKTTDSAKSLLSTDAASAKADAKAEIKAEVPPEPAKTITAKMPKEAEAAKSK